MKLLLLTVLNPDGTRWTRHLTPGAFMVGSSKEAAIQIPDPTLSERHLQLDLDEHGLDLEPLGPNVEVHGVLQSGKTRHGYPALIGVGGLHLKLEAVSQESVAETVAIPLPEQTMVLNWGEHGGEFLQPRAVLQGGYDLLQEIARGGMGRIYLGSDPNGTKIRRFWDEKIVRTVYGCDTSLRWPIALPSCLVSVRFFSVVPASLP